MNSLKTEVIRSVERWRALRKEPSLQGKTLGFVPTMGALHAGHQALLEKSVRENDLTLLSIFVNPTQFDDPKDLRAYPQTLQADLEIASRAGVDFVLAPTPEQIYTDEYRYQLSESELSKTLCGAHRPGHFNGVLTVVMKLLQIASADRAYFGEKDFQQLKLVQGMASAFFLPTEIVPCPIVRDWDGLALSSRNTRLSLEARKKAVLFPETLKTASDPHTARAILEKAGFEVDYIEELEGRRLGAVRIDGVRLIDQVSCPLQNSTTDLLSDRRIGK